MLRLISAERGKRGVLRAYQHPTLGRIEIVTMFGRVGADVIHIDDVRRKTGMRQQRSVRRYMTRQRA